MRYATEMTKLVESSGGSFLFTGEVSGTLIGKFEESWDLIGIARYPSVKSLVEISSAKAFQEIEAHWIAGLAGQLNITTRSPDES